MDNYWTSDEEYSDEELPLPSEILKKIGSHDKLDELLQLYGKVSVPGTFPISNLDDPSMQFQQADLNCKSERFDFNEVDTIIYTYNNEAPELYNFGGHAYVSDGLRFRLLLDESKEGYRETTDKHIKEPAVAKSRLIRLEWAVKDEGPIVEIPDDELLIEFPFKLDGFQKRAIYHISQGKHVFVAAHTSSGKTVVAEYAIAMALSKGRKAVYTSPIKALSNQKYREFSNTFNSVGIITGDVCCNPTSNCLVMTTEILRNLLYRGDSLIGELDVVIFDEVHYISDLSRGVVWEEVIIMLPKVLQLVMLSATVPNYMEFSDWIGRTMQREVVAIVTKKRPTPLVHYLHIHSKNFLLFNSDGFNQNAYHQMYQYAKSLKNNKGKNQKFKSITLEGEIQKLQALIKSLEKNDKLPVILFSFSRAKCETYAKCMPKLDFSKTQLERSKIHLFIKESTASLSESDRGIPQLKFIISLLERGVGIHHSGLLPIIKEMVEMLFSRGLVKVLFATETFAMGVNMPARSVVFTSIRKHDGIVNRALTSSEYTQMAGRAGRRGLDTVGNVFIFCADEPPDLQDLTMMMIERSTPLKSRFRVTYSMLLQVMSRNHMSIGELMSKSFLERNRAKQIPVFKRDMFRRKKELASLGEILCPFGDPTIEEYMQLELKMRGLSLPITKLLWNPKLNIITAGRLLRLHSIAHVASHCTCVVVAVCDDALSCLIALPADCKIKDAGEGMEIVCSASLVDHRVSYYLVKGVTAEHVVAVLNNFLADGALNSTIGNFKLDNSSSDVLELVALSLVSCEITDELVLLPRELKNVPLDTYERMILQRELNGKMARSQCHKCSFREEHFEMALVKGNCIKEIEEISSCLREDSLEAYPEMMARVNLLKQLGFLDSDGVPSIKGRVATYITTTDEITLTEILFQNILKDLDHAECAAILSAFISTDRCKDESPVPTARLQLARDRILEIHRKIYVLQTSLGVLTSRDDFDLLCNFHLLFICYQWACGVPFPEIMEMTSLQEGNIVRAIIRLDELCKKVEHVAILMQDSELAGKMQKTADAIHRDIVFATSLYLKP